MLWRGPMGGGAASGKIGAMIASHCAQGQYLKHRVKCVNPRTELQHPLRNALRSLASMWGTTLNSTQRASWATYAANVTWVNRLGDTVHLSGQMEFCRSNWPRFQIGLPLVLDGPVIFDRGSTGGGTITIGVGNDFGVFAIQAAPPWQDGSTLTACMVYMGLPRSAARTFMAPRTQLSAVLLGTFGALTAFPPLQPRGNVAQYNQAYPSWLVATYSDGRLTTPTPLTPVFTGPPPPPPVVFFDDFPYADGNLAGNGDWTAGGSGFPTLKVSSNTVLCVTDPNASGQNFSPLIIPDSTLPWNFTVEVTTQSTPTGYAYFDGTVIDPAYGIAGCGFVFDFGTGNLNLNLCGTVTISNGITTIATATNVPFTKNTPHTVTLEYDGVNLNLILDGVQILTAAATVAAGNNTIAIDGIDDGTGLTTSYLSVRTSQPPS